ncbi:MAG: hypothetical protein SVG88_01755 [Halobacteriales archaeon]|nr:hypothetical protein [Halobacteriales archaeon]
MKNRILNNGFRLYAVALGLLGGWTMLAMLTDISVASSALGTTWLGLAALGTVLTIGLVMTREEVLALSARQRQEFTTNPLTGTPLSLYIAGLVGWTVVSAAWWLTGFVGVEATVIAYGWFGIAAFGTVLTGGLCMKHLRPLQVVSGTSVRGKR